MDILSIPEQAHTIDQSLLVQRLKVYDITPVLRRKGKFFSVNPGKKDRRKQKRRQCYTNAGRMMHEGYGYVEGICIDKRDGFQFTHAWNVDDEGNHWDFTLDDPENYDYWGIIIPVTKVYEVLSQIDGGTWCSVLVHYKKF